jgi:hypothetical protein
MAQQTATAMATDEPDVAAGAGTATLADEAPSAAHNYVVTAQRPTAVTHAVVGSFTAAGSVDLVLARATRLEVYTLTGEGLQVGVNMRPTERWRRRATSPVF